MNVLDFWRLMGDGIALAFSQAPEYEYRADDRGWLVTAGEPCLDFNCALVMPGARAEETLLSASEFFLERSLPFLVCVVDEPESVASLARDLDLRDIGPLPLMTYCGTEIPSVPEGVEATVREASSADDYRRMAALNEECFGLPAESTGRVAPFGLARDSRQCSLIALSNSELVGAVTLSHFEGASGISGLMTKQSSRRSGIATLVMSEAMARVRRVSNHPMFLATTPMARPLYDRLGFEVIDVGHVWVGGEMG